MARFCTLVTAPDFPAIEKATREWFWQPIKLVYDDEKEKWRVWLPDTKLKDAYQWYVVKQGTRYCLEVLDPMQPAIIHID